MRLWAVVRTCADEDVAALEHLQPAHVVEDAPELVVVHRPGQLSVRVEHHQPVPCEQKTVLTSDLWKKTKRQRVVAHPMRR